MKNEDESAFEGGVIVRGLASAFVQTIETRSHRLIADERHRMIEPASCSVVGGRVG